MSAPAVPTLAATRPRRGCCGRCRHCGGAASPAVAAARQGPRRWRRETVAHCAVRAGCGPQSWTGSRVVSQPHCGHGRHTNFGFRPMCCSNVLHQCVAPMCCLIDVLRSDSDARHCKPPDQSATMEWANRKEAQGQQSHLTLHNNREGFVFV